MSIIEIIIILGMVVMFTHFVGSITGFGPTVMAMPFAILLVGIAVARPVLTVDALLYSGYISFISFKKIKSWKLFWQVIIGVLLGMPFGLLVYSYLPETTLKIALGIFMILVSVKGLLVCFKIMPKDITFSGWILNVFLFLGGVMQAVFVSGGPLVILYATQKIKDKSEFRAILCVMWTITNLVLLAQSLLARMFTSNVNTTILFTLPFLAIGIIVGNLVHYKINEDVFYKITYFVLLLSAIFMFI